MLLPTLRFHRDVCSVNDTLSGSWIQSVDLVASCGEFCIVIITCTCF